mgnify:CR=1 FL=1
MKKYTIKHLLFLLLLVAMAGCTEDPISMAAGKLPDEVAMSKIGGILYSEKSLTNKLAKREVHLLLLPENKYQKK